MFVKIDGETHYMWRTIDHEGEVLDSNVTNSRDKAVVLKFLKSVMRNYGRQIEIVNDGLRGGAKGRSNTIVGSVRHDAPTPILPEFFDRGRPKNRALQY